MMTTDNDTTKADETFIDQVFEKIADAKDAAADLLGEAVDAVKRETAEGGKLDKAKDKVGEFKDVAAGKLGEAVDAVKREAAEGGKLDKAKDVVVEAVGVVKDKIGSRGREATDEGEAAAGGDSQPGDGASA